MHYNRHSFHYVPLFLILYFNLSIYNLIILSYYISFTRRRIMPQLFPNCAACQFQVPLKERSINATIPASEIAAAAVSTQQRIWNTVRLPASEYTMNLAALHVYTAPTLPIGVNWNQGSDRAVAGVVRSDVPSHASSTRHSITRCRPGSTSAPGAGVDVKHGSYDRYLARLKGRSAVCAQTSPKVAATPFQGNKTRSYGVASCS
jgi:hypothetical protein